MNNYFIIPILAGCILVLGFIAYIKQITRWNMYQIDYDKLDSNIESIKSYGTIENSNHVLDSSNEYINPCSNTGSKMHNKIHDINRNGRRDPYRLAIDVSDCEYDLSCSNTENFREFISDSTNFAEKTRGDLEKAIKKC